MTELTDEIARIAPFANTDDGTYEGDVSEGEE